MRNVKKYALGVDIGGTSIKVGVVSKEGKIVAKTAVDTLSELGPKGVVNQIRKGINNVLPEFKKELEGIGIGAPGIVDINTGVVENPPNLHNWKKVNLGKIIEEDFGLRVTVENDANGAAIGELIFGAGRKFNDFIMITLGTGVGGGIIINRKIYRGEIGAAGEIGHTTIDYNGPLCNCGSYGCIETYIGNGYLVDRVIREKHTQKNSKIFKLLNDNLDYLTPKIISDAAQQGDEFAKSVIVDAGRYLGIGLASVVNILDISRIIIGGGVAGFGKVLFDAVENSIRERTLKSLRSRVKIYPAKLRNEAGILGASSLVFYRANFLQ